MHPITALWHFVNFLAPAIGIGCIAAGLAKLIWRRDFKGVAWLRLSAGTGAAMAAVSAAGLVLLGHDGKMATYAAMVLACAFVLWWAGRPKPVS